MKIRCRHLFQTIVTSGFLFAGFANAQTLSSSGGYGGTPLPSSTSGSPLSGTPVSSGPDAVDLIDLVGEVRTILGPPTILQSCVDYTEKTLELCKQRGYNCSSVSYLCGPGSGHAVAIAKTLVNGVEMCQILDATQIAILHGKLFPCSDLKDGTIDVDPLYCGDISPCSCKIVETGLVTGSDPTFISEMFIPTVSGTLTGATHEACVTACGTQYDQFAELFEYILGVCNGETPPVGKGEAQWGIEGWIAGMSREQTCDYARKFLSDLRSFHTQCVDACNFYHPH